MAKGRCLWGIQHWRKLPGGAQSLGACRRVAQIYCDKMILPLSFSWLAFVLIEGRRLNLRPSYDGFSRVKLRLWK